MKTPELNSPSIRFVATLALPFVWVFFLFLIDMSVSDFFPIGDQRWVAVVVNLIFILAWCLLISSRSIGRATRVIGSFIMLAVLSTALYQLKMEGVVLGIFGSPSSDSLKELAIELKSPPGWAHDDVYEPPRAACGSGSYCLDVWRWRTYRYLNEKKFAEEAGVASEL